MHTKQNNQRPYLFLSNLTALVLLFCISIVPVLGNAREESAPCLEVGSWKVPSDNSKISGTVLLNNLRKLPVIMLGETHDNPEHHMWQLHVLSALYGQNKNIVIGFEAFHRAQQPILDRWTKGELSKDKFLELTRWNEVWGYEAKLYLPLFHFARMNRIQMVALNIERSLIKKINRYGWKAIPKDQRQGISTPQPPSTSYTQSLKNIFTMHSNIDSKGPTSKKADDKKLTRFIESQTIWDRAMAEAIAKARAGEGNPTVVAIVGSGHLKYGYGIPHQLSNIGIKSGVVLLPWDSKLSCNELKNNEGIPIAHAIFGVDSLIKKKKPYRPLLGVRIKSNANKLVITDVTDGSIADLARLQKNDLILKAAGKKISKPEELINIIGNQAPGTYLPLHIIRGGNEIEVIAKFPPIGKD